MQEDGSVVGPSNQPEQQVGVYWKGGGEAAGRTGMGKKIKNSVLDKLNLSPGASEQTEISGAQRRKPELKMKGIWNQDSFVVSVVCLRRVQSLSAYATPHPTGAGGKEKQGGGIKNVRQETGRAHLAEARRWLLCSQGGWREGCSRTVC